MAANPPPGMYIDPDDPNRQRFWNGTAWTDHVAPLNDAPAGPAPMYAPLPTNPTMPPAPPAPAFGTPPPPPPGFGAQPPVAPPPYPVAYGSAQGLPMHMRPFSQAAVWSIVLSFFCPLVGIVMAIVGITSTGPNGDRRGRGAAIVGLVLCILSATGGAILGAQMMSNAPTGSTGSVF